LAIVRRIKKAGTSDPKWYNGGMSGHSKWSTIKHQKGATDKARALEFTKLGSAITVAVREGGGIDPGTNIRLRLAVEKARQANMPKDNITRSIERASGKLDSGRLEEVLYEGFAPGGVAVLVEGVTDNKQRTVAQVKNVFLNKGGALGSTGSVAYLFEKVGMMMFAKDNRTAEQILELVLNAGAQDYEETGADVTVYTKPTDLHTVKETLEKQVVVKEAEITYRPQTLVKITEAGASRQILSLLEALDELEDVQKVHANADIDTSLLA
jgi:YebC/PmpR family DNA-binding regulatory protein